MPTLLCEIRDSHSFRREKRNYSFHVTGPKYDIVGGWLSFATDGSLDRPWGKIMRGIGESGRIYHFFFFLKKGIFSISSFKSLNF